MTSEAAQKSGSYGLERRRSEEPVRKNKGGPWRMVGDGAIVVYRRLIINPAMMIHQDDTVTAGLIAATVSAHLGRDWVREGGPGDHYSSHQLPDT